MEDRQPLSLLEAAEMEGDASTGRLDDAAAPSAGKAGRWIRLSIYSLLAAVVFYFAGKTFAQILRDPQ